MFVLICFICVWKSCIHYNSPCGFFKPSKSWNIATCIRAKILQHASKSWNVAVCSWNVAAHSKELKYCQQPVACHAQSSCTLFFGHFSQHHHGTSWKKVDSWLMGQDCWLVPVNCTLEGANKLLQHLVVTVGTVRKQPNNQCSRHPSTALCSRQSALFISYQCFKLMGVGINLYVTFNRKLWSYANISQIWLQEILCSHKPSHEVQAPCTSCCAAFVHCWYSASFCTCSITIAPPSVTLSLLHHLWGEL